MAVQVLYFLVLKCSGTKSLNVNCDTACCQVRTRRKPNSPTALRLRQPLSWTSCTQLTAWPAVKHCFNKSSWCVDTISGARGDLLSWRRGTMEGKDPRKFKILRWSCLSPNLTDLKTFVLLLWRGRCDWWGSPSVMTWTEMSFDINNASQHAEKCMNGTH